MNLRHPSIPSPQRLRAALGVAITLLGGCVLAPVEHDKGAETAPEGLTALSPAAVAESAQGVGFERHVRPVLESKCLACHGGQQAAGNYSLASRSLAFAPGPGGPRLVPGRPDQSLLVAFASTHRNVAAMPLVGNRLTATESRILRRWIAEGAAWPPGRAGMLKPAAGNLRPEPATVWARWGPWFDNASSKPRR